VEEGGPIANPVCIKNRYSLTVTLARQPIRSSLSFNLAGHPSIHGRRVNRFLDARECCGGLPRLSSNSPNEKSREKGWMEEVCNQSSTQKRRGKEQKFIVTHPASSQASVSVSVSVACCNF
jgi:hypothetical protein